MSIKVRCSNQGEKLDNIIGDNPVLAGFVLCYLFEKGIENVQSITQNDINKVQGNDLMSVDFVREIVNKARLVARNCSLYEDIFPYIRHKLPNMYCQTSVVTLSKESLKDCWEDLGQAFAGADIESITDVDWSEIETLKLSITPIEAETDDNVQ